MSKRLEPWVVFGAGAGAAGLVAWAYGWFLAGLSYNFESWRVIAADLLLKIVIPAAGGMAALAWCRLARRSGVEPQRGWRWGRPGRWVAAIVLAAYGITWAFGVPGVITSLTSQEIEEYKRGAVYWQGAASSPYPRIRTLASFPVLPGLIVVYHDAQIAGQSGWGGWVFYVWWGKGSKRIGTLWRRFS
jgi:hypothetical protein